MFVKVRQAMSKEQFAVYETEKITQDSGVLGFWDKDDPDEKTERNKRLVFPTNLVSITDTHPDQ